MASKQPSRQIPQPPGNRLIGNALTVDVSHDPVSDIWPITGHLFKLDMAGHHVGSWFRARICCQRDESRFDKI
jgi:hypothetical protein